jgi:REP element-mobilizing transposase RayT
MPNHFHSIIEITNSSKSTHIGNVIGVFKSLSTNQYIKGVHNYNWLVFEKRLWQKNYYEHIIRSEKSYLYISDYIINNPSKWKFDKFYIA